MAPGCWQSVHPCWSHRELVSAYPLALYNLALAHMHKGQLPRARRYASKALAAEPGNEQILKLSKRLGAQGIWAKITRRLNQPADDGNILQ